MFLLLKIKSIVFWERIWIHRRSNGFLIAWPILTKKDNGYRIELPHRRMDLEENDQDIIEDVARMNGYDAIPTTLAKTSSKGALTEKQQKLRLIRRQLAMMGMNEVTTYSLVSKKSLNDYIDQPQPEIEVLMPLTEERCVLRQSLLNGVVEAVSYNLARKNADLAFFEIGNIYTKEKEELHLAGAITGLWQSLLWRGEKQRADFYTLKGILEVLFAKLNEEVTYRPDQSISCFHPGRCAAIYWHDQKIGVLGALHPRFAKEKTFRIRLFSKSIWMRFFITGLLLNTNRSTNIRRSAVIWLLSSIKLFWHPTC